MLPIRVGSLVSRLERLYTLVNSRSHDEMYTVETSKSNHWQNYYLILRV